MPSLRVHPLSRRPQQRRLVVAVRGAAGAGKSWFAASLADAGLGRLCYFDTERKARLLPGADGSVFDAIEVEHPDELLPFIDWALGEGREEQGYGCYALDSWAMYFGRKHRATVQAARERTGDPTARPSAEELEADQVVLQEVLRRLCVDSGACVVITDQIGARGKEQREENEMGRVLPMTTSGLEYFVDVMLELNLRQDGFETRRVATVVKSNAPDFPVGLEVEGPTFADLLGRMGAGPSPAPLPASVADVLPELPEPGLPAPAGPTVDDLLAEAEALGLAREQVLLAARHYCGVQALGELAPDQTADLLDRMRARYAPQDDTPSGDGVANATTAEPEVTVSKRSRKKAA
ncbi:hypothetical protein RQM47_00920 [Rubrivirga sp. S365]|uniref:AAA domain-containing protein n=1 Tax=Rubrivirga litoralis TaxID=3075598 RepID=A0ABU3BU05_9BACT|nr:MULTISPECIES: hypothetical protein [unclassified Rubrivirga]MDT0632764.1 hypothetical protein [Rubrivirga sp. F394]MDT7855196.1 hypothetical protein [Rubrivirga sp. S365]